MSWPLIGREAELTRVSGLLKRGKGFALLGAAGVGKSRLLEEALDGAERAGGATIRAYATEATRSVPFAPLVGLLPSVDTRDRLELHRAVLEAVERRHSDGRLVVAIDDSHLLDEGSLALLMAIATNGSATLGLTVRTGDPIPPSLTTLWKDEWLERVDLPPLSVEGFGELVGRVLGTVEPDLEAELWRLSRGNPLLLRELIEGSRDTIIKRDEQGVWRLEGQLAETKRLADLIEDRLAWLSDELRDVLELVALGTPLPVAVLAVAAESTMITALEDRDLIATRETEDGLVVTPSHPLYGEVLAAHLGETHRREVLTKLVTAAVAAGLPAPADALRAALWQRDSGSISDPGLAVMGASAALGRHDPPLAEELVRPVAIESRAARPSAVLGMALSYQRRYEESEQVLSSAQAVDAESAATIASARAQNLAFGLGRIDEALEILAAASAEMADPVLSARLDSERGTIAAMPGDFTETLAASRSALDNPAASTVTRGAAYVSLTLAQAMTGDCDGLFAEVDEALQTARDAKAELPLAEDQVLIMKANAHIDAGQIPPAVTAGRERLDSIEGGVMNATWMAYLSLSLGFAGQLSDALETQERAIGLISEFDPFRLEAQFKGGLAVVAGQLGDPEPGRGLEEIASSVPEPRIRIWLERGNCWSRAAAGDVDEAATLAARAGTRALADQHVSWGAWFLHDAARLGHSCLVVEPLREAARSSSGAVLIETMSDHATAEVNDDPDGLADVGRRFRQFGCPLLAAEALAQSAQSYLEHDDSLAASRTVLLSMWLETECQSANTPALEARPSLITPREFEIACAAADGSLSPEIGQTFFISPRTVNNHLAAIYRKTGIGGREELAELLV